MAEVRERILLPRHATSTLHLSPSVKNDIWNPAEGSSTLGSPTEDPEPSNETHLRIHAKYPDQLLGGLSRHLPDSTSQESSSLSPFGRTQ